MKPCEGCGAPATHAGTVRNSDIVIYTCCSCHNEGHWWPCDLDCEVVQ